MGNFRRYGLSLQVKLIGSFALLTLLCALTALVGWLGTLSLDKDVEFLGEESLRTLQEVQILKQTQSTVKAAGRTLQNPSISSTDRNREMQAIVSAFIRGNEALEQYASAVREEDADLWEILVATWQECQGNYDELLKLSRHLDALEIADPQHFALDIADNFDTYKQWLMQLGRAVMQQQRFGGIGNPLETRFGEWLQTVRFNNPEIDETVAWLRQYLTELAPTTHDLIRSLETGDFQGAETFYLENLSSSVHILNSKIGVLRRPIGQAQDDFSAMSRLDTDRIAPNMQRLEILLDQFVAQTRVQVEQTVEAGSETARQTTHRLWMISAACLLIAAVLGYLTPRSIIIPIKRTVRMIQRLEHGDLSRRLRFQRGDELGLLADSMDNMTARLQKLVESIASTSGSLGEISQQVMASAAGVGQGARQQAAGVERCVEGIAAINDSGEKIGDAVSIVSAAATESSATTLQMSANIDEVALNAGELQQAVNETASSIEELAATIRQISDSADGMRDAAATTVSSVDQMNVTIRQVEQIAGHSLQLTEQVRGDAEEGQRAVAATIDGIRAIREMADLSVAAIESLGHKTHDIDKIIRVIGDITEQTNLLALNAAIIAAQAGEQGRSFAVVAEEIRGLATRTSSSTQEIIDTVAAVRNEVERATEAIRQSETRVRAGETLSRSSGEALGKIVTGVQQMATEMQQVAIATREQSQGSRMIQQAMDAVARMSEQIARAIQEQQKGSGLIMRASRRMHERTGQVANAMQEQSKAGRTIAQAAEEVNQMTLEIQSAWEQQDQQSRLIAGSMADISSRTEAGLATAAALQQVVKDLTGQVARLNQEVAFFQLAESDRDGIDTDVADAEARG